MGKIEWTIGPRNFPIAGILPIGAAGGVLGGGGGVLGRGGGALVGQEVQEEGV